MYFVDKRQNESGIRLPEGQTKEIIIAAHKIYIDLNFQAHGTICVSYPFMVGPQQHN